MSPPLIASNGGAPSGTSGLRQTANGRPRASTTTRSNGGVRGRLRRQSSMRSFAEGGAVAGAGGWKVTRGI